MKHTPGPWEAFKGAGWCVRRENANACIKVGISPKCDLIDSGERQHCECEAEANANLIAAAPDLLAALRDLASDVEKVAKDSFWSGRPGTFDDDFATEDPDGYRVWKNAMDAIRKAEGN